MAMYSNNHSTHSHAHHWHPVYGTPHQISLTVTKQVATALHGLQAEAGYHAPVPLLTPTDDLAEYCALPTIIQEIDDLLDLHYLEDCNELIELLMEQALVDNMQVEHQQLLDVEVSSTMLSQIFCHYLAINFNVFKHYCQYYETLPEGMWQKIHHVYSLNHSLNLRCPLIEESYKRILLFACTDPFQFNRADLELVANSIHWYTPLVQLKKYGDQQADPFIIKQHDDLPPQYRELVDELEPDTYLTLDVSDLIDYLGNKQAKKGRQGIIVTPLGLQPSYTILKACMAHWKKIQYRREPRVTIYLPVQITSTNPNIPDNLNWIVRDCSTQGCRISLNTMTSIDLQPGNLIRLTTDNSEEFPSQVGVIRWVKYYAELGELQAGIQYQHYSDYDQFQAPQSQKNYGDLTIAADERDENNLLH